MLQTLPPDLLAHVLQLVLGPEERYVGEGKHFLGVPIRLGTHCRGLSALRLTCKAFHHALREVPLHVTVSTPRHVRSLAASPFRAWNVAAVHLKLCAHEKPELLLYAASVLPDRERQKIVTVGLSGLGVGFYTYGLRQRQLEGMCHMIIRRTTAGSLDTLDSLTCIQRLELWDVSVSDRKLLVCCCCPCVLMALSSHTIWDAAAEQANTVCHRRSASLQYPVFTP